MLSKVTLLKDSFSNYTLAFGKATYDFIGGKTVEVPTAVALAAKSKKDGKGKPLFTVSGLPTIISPREKMGEAEKQNVSRGLRQKRIDECLSSAM